MLRDLRSLAIFTVLVVAVLGGVLAVGLSGRRGIALGPPRQDGGRPGRVVALSLAAEEIIIGLDGPDRLAAVTSLSLDPRFSNVAAEAARVGTAVSGTSIERIVRLGPSLVILAPYTDAAARSALERYGLRLLMLPDFDGIRAIQDGIRRIGAALGLEGRAAGLAGGMDRRIAAARSRIPAGARPPRVLRFDPSDAWVAGSGTVIDDVIRLAGGINAAAEAGITGTRSVRKETVARWDPEVLLVEGEPEDRQAIAARILGEPLLRGVEAARRMAGRGGRGVASGLAILPTRTLTAVSQHAAGAVEMLVEELHPGAPR